MRILMIFIDGIGVGEKDPSKNPFASLPSRVFVDFLDAPNGSLIHGGVGIRADASLGVEGIPQSATGQTALLTGVNAAAVVGRHLNGFPTKALRELLEKHSVLKTLTERGVRAAFINVFNPLFFEALGKGLPMRSSVTTVANFVDDLLARRAVYQDFTNGLLIEKGFEVPVFEPGEAGRILADSAMRYDFCLYEYFQSDAAGHAQNKLRAVEEVRKLDEFLLAAIETYDLGEGSVLLTSDHGNLEDLSTSGHTNNPVPVLLWGSLTGDAPRIRSILDVTPLVLDRLTSE
jgi:hypothetical protein